MSRALQSRKWTDNSGQERYTTEIVLQRFRGELMMLDSAAGGNGARPRFSPAPQAHMSTRELLDDDIPF